MNCEEAVGSILRHRDRGIVVATMSAIKWVDQLDPHGLNIACVPLMGGAGALGLGLAVAQPERPVLVLDGDGSALMQLGTFVTSAAVRPANYVHFVFNNGVWFENLANIEVPGASRVDYAALARGAGYASVQKCATLKELEAAMGRLLRGAGPHFVELSIEPQAGNLWSSENPQPDLKDFHFARMGDEARRLARGLVAAGTT
jgi:thiamine pyrophosphate-dependent acetolactate synthase large subunit-like protein